MSTSPDLPALLASLLPALLAQRGELLAIKDIESGRHVYINALMAAFMGKGADAAIGRTDAELFDATIATALRAAEQTALAQNVPLLSDHAFEWAGQRHEFSVLRTLVGAEGPKAWLCSIWTDQRKARQRDAQLRTALGQLEQQQQSNEQLRRELADAAVRDPASGLNARAQFEDQLRREVDLSVREHREFALVFIEIDKPSDTVHALGEAARARIHEAMGRLLRGGTRAMDASCRIDERRFAVLLSGVGLATAHSRMEGLRRQCATQIVLLQGQEIGFTAAMGVASFPHTAQSREDLLASCEAALAEAQRRGGNHVTLASIRLDAA